MYYDNDADLDLLKGKTVAILGYGSQGHAHSLNLKDSGIDVVVGLRPDSASVEQARSNGLEVTDVADAASRGDIVMVLLPDEKHGEVWREQIRDGIAPGNTLLFGHGFSVHYGEVEPPPEVDVALIAPKGPGHLVRRQFLEGSGVPGLVAIHANASGDALPLALAYAKGIGCTRGGVIETTFKDETETDLFGEQAVLCGGVSELVRAGYETLVDAGYDPKLAYFECLHELKLIVDLMYEKGITGMRFSVSNTAEYGDLTRGQADHLRRHAPGDEGRARRDPVGRVRARVDRREPRRAGELQAHARGAGRPPDRARGQGAALDDGLDRDRVLSAMADEPTAPGWLPPRAPGGRARAAVRVDAGGAEPEPATEPEAAVDPWPHPINHPVFTRRRSRPHERPRHDVARPRHPRPRDPDPDARRRLDLLAAVLDLAPG